MKNKQGRKEGNDTLNINPVLVSECVTITILTPTTLDSIVTLFTE